MGFLKLLLFLQVLVVELQNASLGDPFVPGFIPSDERNGLVSRRFYSSKLAIVKPAKRLTLCSQVSAFALDGHENNSDRSEKLFEN